MDLESTSGLTIIAILYGLGFFLSFLSFWVSLLLGFTGVLLIIGLSIMIDGLEKKRTGEHNATLADLEKLRKEIDELKNSGKTT